MSQAPQNLTTLSSHLRHTRKLGDLADVLEATPWRARPSPRGSSGRGSTT
jgi:hypothetical protein